MENDGQRTLAGQPIQSVAPRIRRSEGLFSAMGTEFGAALRDVGTIWGSYFDEQQPAVTPQEAEEIIGNRPVEYRQGETAAALERRVAYYDMDEYRAGTERSAGAEAAGFVASIPPYVAEPVTLATLPVGASRVVAARSATTFAGFMKNTSIGAAQVAAVSAPLDAAQFTAVRGEFDPASAVAATLAPFALMPALGALPWWRANRFNAQTANGVARESGIPPNEVPAATAAMERPDVGSPPIRSVRSEPEVTPQARVNEMFADSPYSPRAFLQDVVDNNPRAQRWAERHGVDLNSSAIRDLIDDLRVQAQTLPDNLNAARQRLPRGLRGADPRSGSDRLVFMNDIDKALYIVTRRRGDGVELATGPTQEPYFNWLTERAGLSEEQILQIGAQVKQAVRQRSRDTGARIEVPRVFERVATPEAQMARAKQMANDIMERMRLQDLSPAEMGRLMADAQNIEAMAADAFNRAPTNIADPSPEDFLRALHEAGMQRKPDLNRADMRPSPERLSEALHEGFDPSTVEILRQVGNTDEARAVLSAYSRLKATARRCFE